MGFSLQLKVITFLKGKAHNFETKWSKKYEGEKNVR